MESSTVKKNPGTPVWAERPVRGGFVDEGILARSGLDQLRHVLRAGGPAPPLHHLTGLSLTQVDVGTCVFVMPATEWLLSAQGLLAGGAVALVVDAALGTAVQTTLPPATLYTTAELTIYLLRPVPADEGLLTARARIVRSGRSVAVSEAIVCDSQGRAVARASSRCHIFPPLDLPSGSELPDAWVKPSYEGPDPYERPTHGGIAPLDEWARRSGMEQLEAQRNGDLPMPPIHHLTGVQPVAWSDGTCVAVGPASPWLAAPHGNVHGGALSLLADTALAGAVSTTVPAGQGYAMLDLKMNFIRPVVADGNELTARGKVLHRGRTACIATAELTNSSDRTVAIASGSALMLDRPVLRDRPVDADASR